MRDVKLQRRAREVLGLGDGNKVAEMPQFHSRFTLPFGYAQATNIVFHNGAVLGRWLFGERKEPVTRILEATERKQVMMKGEPLNQLRNFSENIELRAREITV